MAQALYLRESDGNHIILNQRERYGEAQIAQMRRNEGLQGGGVMEDTELSGLARGFLNRQGGVNIAVTDDKVNALGAYMTATMRDINYARKSGNLRNETLHRWKLLSAARVLETLGIPYQRELTEQGEYVSATICGVTFSTDMEASETVNQKTLCPSGDFGCPYWTESGHCALQDPAHECDDYMYCNGVDAEND